jgi:uroporphyrinogen decarboxylase-like protein
MAEINGILASRKSRWRRFLDPEETDTPALMFFVRCAEGSPARPALWPQLAQQRIEWAWEHYQWQCRQATWLDDDTVPCLQISTGTEVFAEALGCPVHRAPDQMPFALPLLHSAAEVADLTVPEVSTSSLAYLFDLADELRRRAGPEAVVRLVDIQTPMDIAALIWEKSEFLAAMISAPEAVHELADKVGTLLMRFLDEWFGRYGTEFVAHYPDYFMDGGITVSEDEVGEVSTAMFSGFFSAELESLSRRYGGIGIHCCAHARHQWPQFARVPGLRLINLHQPHAVVTAAYAAFGSRVAQLHYGFEHTGPVETWPSQHPADRRIIYDIHARDPEHARELSARLTQLRAVA